MRQPDPLYVWSFFDPVFDSGRLHPGFWSYVRKPCRYTSSSLLFSSNEHGVGAVNIKTNIIDFVKGNPENKKPPHQEGARGGILMRRSGALGGETLDDVELGNDDLAGIKQDSVRNSVGDTLELHLGNHAFECEAVALSVGVAILDRLASTVLVAATVSFAGFNRLPVFGFVAAHIANIFDLHLDDPLVR